MRFTIEIDFSGDRRERNQNILHCISNWSAPIAIVSRGDYFALLTDAEYIGRELKLRSNTDIWGIAAVNIIDTGLPTTAEQSVE